MDFCFFFFFFEQKDEGGILGDAGGGLGNHGDALPSPSSLGAAKPDLAQPMAQVWGAQRGIPQSH